ncbi:hypothetical protein PCC79_11395 [Propioniciclava soli]|uniref:Allophanate hydrolase C-terminal domain-containing protein n=1 Tax=Propioniciclava soli TaxID=2775081 RepID=A0ABZ3C6Y6_9ACTN
MGETSPDVEVAVVGAHLSGMPLNHQLVEAEASLVVRSHTAPRYRLFDLGLEPARPGLVRDVANGTVIEVEVWALSEAAFGRFVNLLASPLAMGHIELTDGRWVNGFVCEPYALGSATDISSCGGWRRYVSQGAVHK